MANITITAADVVAADNAARADGIAAQAIGAGQIVYRSSTTRKWHLADADAVSAEARKAVGIALNTASAGQPLVVATSGDITVGEVLTAGTAYYLSDDPGMVCPLGDVTGGDYICLIGLARSTSVLALDIQHLNVATS